MPPQREAIDWKHVHERLERARRRLEEGVELSEEAARGILENRAAALAQPLPEAAALVETVELLVFSRGEEDYAVAAASVAAVVPLVDPVQVPFTPPALPGVVNHRGRILPVLDLGELLQGGRAETEPSLVIAVEAGEAAFGIGADEIAEVATVAAHELRPAAELAEQPDGVVRGLAGTTAVLDLEALARDPRVEVNDEIS